MDRPALRTFEARWAESDGDSVTLVSIRSTPLAGSHITEEGGYKTNQPAQGDIAAATGLYYRKLLSRGNISCQIEIHKGHQGYTCLLYLHSITISLKAFLPLGINRRVKKVLVYRKYMRGSPISHLYWGPVIFSCIMEIGSLRHQESYSDSSISHVVFSLFLDIIPMQNISHTEAFLPSTETTGYAPELCY